MNLYNEYIKSSISMSDDGRLKTAIKKNLHNIEIVIESGTYLGAGSTKMLIDIFNDQTSFIKLITIEVNKKFHKIAKQNLNKYAKVECINGLSVTFSEAKDFILNDEYLKNHKAYDTIFIDNIEDPISFYLNELNGQLNSNNRVGFFKRIRLKPFIKENVLIQSINRYKQNRLLIVLDSAGGIGYLEFKKVLQVMKNENFFILLDDIHHIKHFRSFQDLKNNPDANIIDFSIEQGWALVEINHK